MFVCVMCHAAEEDTATTPEATNDLSFAERFSNALDDPEAKTDFQKWAVHTHSNVSKMVSDSASWMDHKVVGVLPVKDDITEHTSDRIDNFFGDPSVYTRANSSRLEISPSLTLQSKDPYVDPDVGFGLNLELPILERRFHIFVDNLDGDSSRTSGPKPPPNQNTKESGNAFGILFKIYSSEALNTHFTLGTRKVYYPYARYTISYRWERGPWLMEPSQEIMFRSDKGWEETTGFVVDRQLGVNKMVRSSTYGSWGEDTDGFEYGQTFSYYHMMKIGQDKGGFSTDFNIGGHRVGEWLIDNYTLSMAFRRKIKWDWLFFEIGPKFDFPRDHDYNLQTSVELSLDIIFQHYAGE